MLSFSFLMASVTGEPENNSLNNVNESKDSANQVTNNQEYERMTLEDQNRLRHYHGVDRHRCNEANVYFKLCFKKIIGINLRIIKDINHETYNHTLNNFRCKLSEIPVSRPINGQDACSPGIPAFLTIDKLKLHYVVHYMLRGTWSSIVPEEQDEGRIEFYQCNICQRRFKNYLTKKEFPARGSVICHLATDHGHLLDAMRNDNKVDMQSVSMTYCDGVMTYLFLQQN